MLQFDEAFAGLATHSLCWRIGGAKVRICLFKFSQLAEQSILLRIRNRRCVEHVIQVLVVFNLRTQIGDELRDGESGFGHEDAKL